MVCGIMCGGGGGWRGDSEAPSQLLHSPCSQPRLDWSKPNKQTAWSHEETGKAAVVRARCRCRLARRRPGEVRGSNGIQPVRVFISGGQTHAGTTIRVGNQIFNVSSGGGDSALFAVGLVMREAGTPRQNSEIHDML